MICILTAFQQVSNKVNFPREPKVSSACKSLINKILAPLKARIKISGIKQDQWYAYTPSEKAGSSRDQGQSVRSLLLYLLVKLVRLHMVM